MPKAASKGRQVRRWPPKINYMYEYATMVNGKPEGPITKKKKAKAKGPTNAPTNAPAKANAKAKAKTKAPAQDGSPMRDGMRIRREAQPRFRATCRLPVGFVRVSLAFV